MNLTDEEYAALNLVTTEASWFEVCAMVKERRGGEYPNDWYLRVIASGLLVKITARFGGSDAIGMVRK